MLLSIKYDVINSLDIDLVFDDNSTKHEHVSVGDVVDCAFAKNGCRKTIEGTVKQIVLDTNPCKKQTWYMIVDASTCGSCAVERIEINKILDIDILRRGAGLQAIHTPSNRMRVTDFRMNGNRLELTTDYGKHWFKVADIRCATYDVPEEYQELAAKIDALLPPYMNPGVRSDLIVALVNLFKDTNPQDINTRKIEEALNMTISEVAENTNNIDIISRVYALSEQGDEDDFN